MTCRMCSAPLSPKQGVYCSKQCQYRGQIAPRQQQRCALCPRMLTSRQIGRRQRCCSFSCARLVQIETTPVQDALLDILRANRDWFLTLSDLSLWVYGHDDQSDLGAIRTLLCNLRKRGYRFERRAPIWLNCHGTTRAYRLISEPTMATRGAA